jgi:4-hydroxybutyrate dehydrogenase/sulfolactaldehyde 3-reductase
MRRSAGSPAMPTAANRCSWWAVRVKDFERVKPLLEAMGSTIYHCGEVGMRHQDKLVNNFLAVSSCQMNAEALALSQRFGLDLERTLDVLYGTTAVNGQLKINWPRQGFESDDTEPAFTIDLAHKDLTLIIDAPMR